MEKKIYIPSKSGHDYSKALKFGTPVYISEGWLNKYDVNNLHRLVSEAMKDSSENDYVMLTGLPILFAITCSTFVSKHGRLNLLLFKNGDYLERNLTFGGQQNETAKK